MLKQTLAATTLLLGLAIPATSAVAYYTPEEVLMNQDLFLPPTPRETQDRSSLQASEAAARRAREQEAAFALQRPRKEEPGTLVVEEPAPAAQPAIYAIPMMPGGDFAWPGMTSNTTADLELLRTIRLLGRVNQNQQSQQITQVLGEAGILHSGAGFKPLAPTGAPAILSALIMIGAVAWTMMRAKTAGKRTRLIG